MVIALLSISIVSAENEAESFGAKVLRVLREAKREIGEHGASRLLQVADSKKCVTGQRRVTETGVRPAELIVVEAGKTVETLRHVNA